MKILMVLLVVTAFIAGCVDSSSDGDSSDVGVGGSTAQFVIQQGHLITVEPDRIQLFDLADSFSPELVSSYKPTGRLDVETVFPYQNNRLLFGTTEGVVIMDHSTPGTLTEVSFASHLTSCDPVIAQGNYMYVTLRDGRSCDRGFNAEKLNQLIVYDITDDTRPIRKTTVELDQPWGLGISGTSLFVCYASGLKEYDVTNPINPVEVADYTESCNDIIASTNPMIITGDDGIRLVEKDGPILTELSTIQAGQ